MLSVMGEGSLWTCWDAAGTGANGMDQQSSSAASLPCHASASLAWSGAAVPGASLWRVSGPICGAAASPGGDRER